MEKEILLIIVGCLFLCYSIYLKYFKEKYSHTWRKKSANKVLEKIKHFRYYVALAQEKISKIY